MRSNCCAKKSRSVRTSAEQRAVFIGDGSDALAHVKPPAVTREQGEVGAESDLGVGGSGEDLDERLVFPARGLVDQLEDLAEGFPLGLIALPTQQVRGSGIKEGDLARVVGTDNGLPNAAQGGGQPSFLPAQGGFHARLRERHLQGEGELMFFYRFQQVTVGAEFCGPAYRGFVGMGGEEDDREAELLLQDLGRADAVALAFEPDVHEYQVRTEPSGQLQGLVRVRGETGATETPVFEGVFEFEGDEPLVLDDQDVALGGGHHRCSDRVLESAGSEGEAARRLGAKVFCFRVLPGS